MLKFTFKVSMFIAIVFSEMLQAKEPPIDKLPPQEQPLTPAITVQTCPQDFYSLPLFSNPKFCQLFSETLPASMSYFAMSDQQTVKAFYLKELGKAENENMLKGRVILKYANDQKIIIISKDGQGSQIDILVKPQN